jgi:glycosyltransferase involved in cell wall biosynthesis
VRVTISLPSLAPEFGGPVTVAGSLATALRGRGHQVVVVGCDTGDGVELPTLLHIGATPVPRTVGRLRQYVRSSDVTHVLGYRDPVGSISALTAARNGVPVIFEPCGMHRVRLRSRLRKRAFDRLLGHLLLRSSAGIVASSALERSELVEDGLSGNVIEIRPNGVGQVPSRLDRRDLRRSFGIPDDKKIVLAFGRVAAKKRLVDLVEVLASDPTLVGVVIGPDQADGSTERILGAAAQRGVSDRLFLSIAGRWGLEKWQALAGADCLCLPSATENFGIVAAEAAAVGTPVVITEQCGVAEWLSPSSTFVVPVGDPGALSAATSKAVHEEAIASARRVAAMTRRRLSWDTIAEQQEEMYKKAVANR